MNGGIANLVPPTFRESSPVSGLFLRVPSGDTAPQTKFNHRVTNVPIGSQAGAARSVPESGARDRR